MAIGARSQSARTYLEKHLNTFMDCDLNELVAHGLRALRDTLPNEVDLNTKVKEQLQSYHNKRLHQSSSLVSPKNGYNSATIDIIYGHHVF